jgi:type VI secretion system secreted protein VgrG
LTATPYAILASGVGAGDITATMLSSGAVTSDKIAAGAVKGYQIDDGGSAAYQAFQTAAQSVSSNGPLSFTSLALIAPTNGVTPAFSLAVSGLNLGTVVGFSGSEGLSRPYYYVVEVQSSGPALNTDAELGLSASLTFTRNGRTIAFGGIVTACTLSGASSTGLLYTVRIEPPLAYLGFTTDYRIYQNLSVPDVASSVYQSGASNALTSSLHGNYLPHDYLSQYAETDLNFFNRLLEYNGLFYFFNQSANPPTLTLGDATASYLSAPNSSFVYYGDTATNVPTGADYIRTFQKASHQFILKSTVDAYNFQTPHTDLTASAPNTAGVGEHYEFSAVGATPTDDRVIAGVRRERTSVKRATIAGSGTAPDLRPGYTFTLTDQTGAGLGGTYVVTDVQHAGFVRVTNGVSTLFYGNQFQVIPASLPYRPALQTPKPCLAPPSLPASPARRFGRTNMDG